MVVHYRSCQRTPSTPDVELPYVDPRTPEQRELARRAYRLNAETGRGIFECVDAATQFDDDALALAWLRRTARALA